jgi:heterodisulfide reductase subunit C
MNDPETANEPMTITPDLAQKIREELGQNVYLCYQCVKCTSGCPVGRYCPGITNTVAVRRLPNLHDTLSAEPGCKRDHGVPDA